ncbi:hypothetical protein RZS08_53295, partial [Arthrospira platensis SPKY1]|nr:hypothetical protein [Arthrospira platensis SPKY1]
MRLNVVMCAFRQIGIVGGFERRLAQAGKHHVDEKRSEAQHGAQFEQARDGEPADESAVCAVIAAVVATMGSGCVQRGFQGARLDHLEEVEPVAQQHEDAD